MAGAHEIPFWPSASRRCRPARPNPARASRRDLRNPGTRIDGPPLGDAVTNNTQMTGEKAVSGRPGETVCQRSAEPVNFAFNSARLDATARGTLREQAHWIRQFPEVRFRVYGHTDAVGSDAYNERLGRRRAHAVVELPRPPGDQPRRGWRRWSLTARRSR